MNSNDKKIKQELIAKRKIIKNKLDLLKHGEVVREQIFSPITKHLKSIENKLEDSSKRKNDKLKLEDDYKNDSFQYVNPKLKGEEEETDLSLITSTPRHYSTSKRFKNKFNQSNIKQSILEDLREEENKENEFEQSQITEQAAKFSEASFNEYLEQYEALPRKYIHDMITDDNKEFDQKYGVRHNPITEKFYIGDSALHIDGSDVIVKGKKYKGTRGLYELLFKKYPVNFTLEDEAVYKNIVLKTNAARRYYKSTNQIDGSKLEKYKRIIAPTISGKGMFMEVTKDPTVNYVHWDDPNELVDRLRLLIASKEAGHTGHQNEINSIVEELREAKIIA